MSDNRKFFLTGSTIKFYLISGLIFAGVGVLSFVFNDKGTGNNFLIIVGIVFIAIAVWSKGRVVVTLAEDHMDIKTAPAAPRKMILYSEMNSIEKAPPKKKAFIPYSLILHYTQDGKTKKIRVPIVTDENGDENTFVNELESKIG